MRDDIQCTYTITLASVVLLGGVVIPGATHADIDIKETKDFITVSDSGNPILEYQRTCDPNKVYVSKLYTPSGLQVLLDSPADHVHHHGLMYALDSGKSTWWTDGEDKGKQVPAGKTKTEHDKQAAVIRQSLDWNTSAGKTILKESRTITAHRGKGLSATLLSWRTVLSVAGSDPAPLATRKHYAGLGIRFVRKMDKIGTFIFPDGSQSTSVRGTEKVTPAKWCAYVTRIDDKPVTVAMFSAPSNFRHPTFLFTMTAPFAYISATLNLYRQPYTLKPDASLDLTYGIAIFDGKRDGSVLERTYQKWLKLVRNRPAAAMRMDAKDHGIVLRYGDGPGRCDILGARDVWVFKSGGSYYMHYDAAGSKGWLCSLAVSKDLLTWEKKGPILDFGKPGEVDSKSASYGVTYHDGKEWHMFYLGTPNTSGPPSLVPSFPYLTLKAKGKGPAGPWIKQKKVVPFWTKPDTYYSITASPGQVVKHGGEYLQFFSATTRKPGNRCVQRTLGIARTKDLDGPWTVDPNPMVPIEEQIENSSLYYEKSIKTWFLFTNHIGIDRSEYTDAIWVYWSKDLNKWDPANKAVVLDGQNCTWSKKCIGLPSVVQVGKRLGLFYDAPGGNSTSHMKRHIGLAWLDLPLTVPRNEEKPLIGVVSKLQKCKEE